jgi:hypothetical protein
LGKAKKFRKDFTPEQYEAYLLRKAKESDALIPDNRVKGIKKFRSKKKIG